MKALKFLIDNACSPKLADGLVQAGYDAIHVLSVGRSADSDESLFDFAATQERVIVTADTDFGTLLALRKTPSPSVIQFRRSSSRSPAMQLQTLLAEIPSLTDDLIKGSIVTIEDSRIRVRALPI